MNEMEQEEQEEQQGQQGQENTSDYNDDNDDVYIYDDSDTNKYGYLRFGGNDSQMAIQGVKVIEIFGIVYWFVKINVTYHTFNDGYSSSKYMFAKNLLLQKTQQDDLLKKALSKSVVFIPNHILESFEKFLENIMIDTQLPIINNLQEKINVIKKENPQRIVSGGFDMLEQEHIWVNVSFECFTDSNTVDLTRYSESDCELPFFGHGGGTLEYLTVKWTSSSVLNLLHDEVFLFLKIVSCMYYIS